MASEAPKSPHEKRLVHQLIYKNARGRTPPWKEMYRKRCMDRLRSSRSQLVNRFRGCPDELDNNNSNMISDIMEIEWATMKQTPESFEMQYDISVLMEEIQQELKKEEERLLFEFLSSDEAMMQHKLAIQDQVICPVCQARGLREGLGHQVVCECGLALQSANLSLHTVKNSLENCLAHHRQLCDGQMAFSPTSDVNGTNVLITCQACDWMSFLL